VNRPDRLTEEIRRLYEGAPGAGAAHGNRPEYGAFGGRPKGLEQYWSPPEVVALVSAVVRSYFPEDPPTAVDLTAGAGYLLAPFPHAVGLEFDPEAVALASATAEVHARLHADVPDRFFRVVRGDVRTAARDLARAFPGALHLFVLNPPFGLVWDFRRDGRIERMNSAEFVVRAAYSAAADGGLVVAVLPRSIFDGAPHFRRFREWLEPRLCLHVRLPSPWSRDSDIAVVALARGLAPPEPVRLEGRPEDLEDLIGEIRYRLPGYPEFLPPPPADARRALAEAVARRLEAVPEPGARTPMLVLRESRGRTTVLLRDAPPWFDPRIRIQAGRTLEEAVGTPGFLEAVTAAAASGALRVDPRFPEAARRALARLHEALLPVMPLHPRYDFFFARDGAPLRNLFASPVTVEDSRGRTHTFYPDRRYFITYRTLFDKDEETRYDDDARIRRTTVRPTTYIVIADRPDPAAWDDSGALFRADRVPELERLFRPEAVPNVRSLPEFARALEFVRRDPVVARIPLMDWQAEDVAAAVALPRRGDRAMFIADTGLGKSHMTVAAAVARMRMTGRRGIVLFVTKADLIPPLRERVDSWGFPTAVLSTVEDVLEARRNARNPGPPLVAFVSYDALKRRSHTRRLPPLRASSVLIHVPPGAEKAARRAAASVFGRPPVRWDGSPASLAVRTSGGPPYRPADFDAVLFFDRAPAPGDIAAALAHALVRPSGSPPKAVRHGKTWRIEWPNGARAVLRPGRGDDLVRLDLRHTLRPTAARTACCLRPFGTVGRPRPCKHHTPEDVALAAARRLARPDDEALLARRLADLSGRDGVSYFNAPGLLRKRHPEEAARLDAAFGPGWEGRAYRLHPPERLDPALLRKLRPRLLDADPRLPEPWIDSLAGWIRRLRLPVAALILDEVDLAADSTSALASHLARIAHNVPIRYGATATLIPNWPYQAYFPLKLVYDRFLPYPNARAFNDAVQAYVVVEKTFLDTHSTRSHRRILPDHVNYAEWLRRIAPLCIRRTYENAPIDREIRKTFVYVPTPLTPEQAELYRYWIDRFVEWFRTHVRDDLRTADVRLRQAVLGQITKLRQAGSATPGAFPFPDAPVPPPDHMTWRMAYVAAVARLGLEAGRRFIVFCPFVEEARRVAAVLEDLGHRILLADGSLDPDERGRIILAANRDKAVDGLVTTLNAVGRGHDLQGFGLGIVTGGEWRPGQYIQIAGRMARIGQEHGVVPLVVLDTPGTLGDYIASLLNAKHRDIDRLVDARFDEPRSLIDSYLGEVPSVLRALHVLLRYDVVRRMADRLPVVPAPAPDLLGAFARNVRPPVRRIGALPEHWGFDPEIFHRVLPLEDLIPP